MHLHHLHLAADAHVSCIFLWAKSRRCIGRSHLRGCVGIMCALRSPCRSFFGFFVLLLHSCVHGAASWFTYDDGIARRQVSQVKPAAFLKYV